MAGYGTFAKKTGEEEQRSGPPDSTQPGQDTSAAPTDKKQEQSASRARSCWLDNCKFVLMVLVVCGHFETNFATFYYATFDSNWISRLFAWHYLFEMAMFSFVSGVVSKGAPTPQRLERLFVSIFLPIYLSTLWGHALMNPLDLPHVNWIFTAPSGPLPWYLCALVFWRLLGYLLQPLGGPRSFVLVLFISLASGYAYHDPKHFHPSFFSVTWSLLYWPFFQLGVAIDLDLLLSLVRNTRTYAVACLGALGCFFAWFLYGTAIQPFYAMPGAAYGPARSFSPLPVFHDSFLWVHRFAWYFFGSTVGLLFILCIPDREFFFTIPGQRSLYAYLIHTRVLSVILQVFGKFMPNTWHGFGTVPFADAIWVLALASMILLVWFLCSQLVQFVMWPVIEPTWVRRLYPDYAAKIKASSASPTCDFFPTSDPSRHLAGNVLFYGYWGLSGAWVLYQVYRGL